MRNLLVLVILVVAGFILVGMYVAPSQPALREWYLKNACEHLDKLTTQICAPLRQTGGGERT